MRLNFLLMVCIALVACGGDDDIPADGSVRELDSSATDAASPVDSSNDARLSEDAGTPPDSESPPDTGSDGTIADGGAPSPLPPKEDVLKAAFLYASCVPDDGTTSFLRDVYRRQEGLLDWTQVVECIAQGNGCDAIERCTGLRVTYDGPCTTECREEVLHACDDSRHFALDCGFLGQVCDAAESDCVPATPPSTQSCDFSNFEATCTDGRPRNCFGDEVNVGPECTDFGLVCISDGFGFAQCSGAEGDCQSISGSTLPDPHIAGNGTCLDADRAQICANDGLHTVSCSEIDPSLSCHDGACLYANECEDNRRVTCEGSTAVVCAFGQVHRFDCPALGFSGCNAGTHPFGCMP